MQKAPGAVLVFGAENRIVGHDQVIRRTLSMIDLLSAQILVLNSKINAPTARAPVHRPGGWKDFARTAVISQGHTTPGGVFKQDLMGRSKIEITNDYKTKPRLQAVLKHVLKLAGSGSFIARLQIDPYHKDGLNLIGRAQLQQCGNITAVSLLGAESDLSHRDAAD